MERTARSLSRDEIERLRQGLVVSVPHCGTNTLEVLLFKVLARHRQPDIRRQHTHKVDGYHQLRDRIAALELSDNALLAVPMRWPASVWASWSKRELRSGDQFVRSWQILQAFIDDFAPVIVPFDLPQVRDAALRCLHPDLVYEDEHENHHPGHGTPAPLTAAQINAVRNLPAVRGIYPPAWPAALGGHD